MVLLLLLLSSYSKRTCLAFQVPKITSISTCARRNIKYSRSNSNTNANSRSCDSRIHADTGTSRLGNERFFFADWSGNNNTPAKQKENAVIERKRVVFLGTPEVASETLSTLYKASLESLESTSPWEISAVVTQPAKRTGRKKKLNENAPVRLTPSPVAVTANELNISTVLTPEKANDKDFLDYLQYQIKPDLCITAAYGQYLPKRFLATPKLGTLNIHPSLLPKWRGASPVQRALQNGDNPLGVTVLYTVSKMDAGPIIAQKEQHVSSQDTASQLLPIFFQLGTNLLLDALPNIWNEKITMQTAQPQNEVEATAAALIDSSEGELKVWEETATQCHNKFRAFDIWPGVYLWIQIQDQDNIKQQQDPLKVKVIECRVRDDLRQNIVGIPPTREISMGPNKKQDGLRLVCFDGSVLEIMTLQPATKRPYPARDFCNGYSGQRFFWTETPNDFLRNSSKYNSRQLQQQQPKPIQDEETMARGQKTGASTGSSNNSS